MDESRSRLNKPLALAAVAVALILGLMVGSALDVGKRLFGGPDPETVASSALQSMRAQNRLVPFVARYVSVVSSRQERLGGLVSSERTLILPGDVRYELDLAQLGPEDVQWDAGSSTLSVTLPEIEIAGPERTWGGLWLPWVGGAFMLGRVAHAIGMDGVWGAGRGIGTALTMLTQLGLAAVAVLAALRVI